jgi:cytochrome c biogenesis factor
VVNPSKKHDTQDEKARFEIEFVTPEYIVMHAKIFPYIIILWWGCIIMCLGTLMAVIYRIKQNRLAKN